MGLQSGMSTFITHCSSCLVLRSDDVSGIVGGFLKNLSPGFTVEVSEQNRTHFVNCVVVLCELGVTIECQKTCNPSSATATAC